MCIDYKKEIVKKIDLTVSYYNNQIPPNFISRKDYLMWLIYFCEYEQNLSIKNRIETVLKEVLSESTKINDYSLWYGKSGLIFLLLALGKYEESTLLIEDLYSHINELLNSTDSDDYHTYDLFQGLLGIVLLLLKIDDVESKYYLDICIEKISLISNELLEIEKKKDYNIFAVTHGIGGFISFLGLYNQKYSDLPVISLINQLIDYYRKYYNATTKVISYDNRKSISLKWCTGEFGIAAALTNVTSKILSDENRNFKKELLNAVNIRLDTLTLNEMPFIFCHGLSSIYYITLKKSSYFPSKETLRRNIIEHIYQGLNDIYLDKTKLFENINDVTSSVNGLISIALPFIAVDSSNDFYGNMLSIW